MLAQFPELLIDGITVERELVTKVFSHLGIFIDENVT